MSTSSKLLHSKVKQIPMSFSTVSLKNGTDGRLFQITVSKSDETDTVVKLSVPVNSETDYQAGVYLFRWKVEQMFIFPDL